MNNLYDINHPTLNVGDETVTFEMGKIVKVKITKVFPSEEKNIYGHRYHGEYIGNGTICLDLGQKWYLKPGEQCIFHQMNIDAAKRYLNK